MVEAEDAAEKTPLRRRTWLPMAIWTAAIVAGLALVCGGVSLYVPLSETRDVLKELTASSPPPDWCPELLITIEPGSAARAVERLGGQERAAGKIVLYRRFAWIVPGRPLRDAGAAVLSQCGKAGLPGLIDGLKDKEAHSRANHALGLASAGEHLSDEAVAALVGTLDDSDDVVRVAALTALWELGPRAKAALPTLERLRAKPGAPGREHIDKAIRKIRGD